MLLKGTTAIKKYLPSIILKGEQFVFDDAIIFAENELKNNILGTALYNRFTREETEDADAREIINRIIAINAFLSVISDMDVVLTESGFAVQNSEKLAPASKQRVEALTNSLRTRVDASTDALLELLITSISYDEEWRTSEQYNRLSAGLIITYKDFKRVAILTRENIEFYPQSYSAMSTLYAKMAFALRSLVSSFLGITFIEKLIEDIRDRETLSSETLTILPTIKSAVVAYAMDDKTSGNNIMTTVVSYMNKNKSAFPSVVEYRQGIPDGAHSDTPIFSML